MTRELHLKPRLTIALAILTGALLGAALTQSAFATPASISGVAWHDLNADGVRQPDEPGAANLRITLISSLDASAEVLTDSTGRYSFLFEETGTYVVRIDGIYDHFLTSPMRSSRLPYEVAVRPGSSDDIDFGLHQTLSIPLFAGMPWKDGEPLTNAKVAATVNGVDCTGPSGLRPPHSEMSYQVSVASAAILPGCGVPGNTIRFTINGEPANETAIWQAIAIALPDPSVPGRAILPPSSSSAPSPGPPSPSNRTELDLTIGPAFAWWVPQVQPFEESFEDQGMYVEAFVDGTLCGRADRPGMPGVLLVVPSRELKPGCGYEGAKVNFSVKGEPSVAAAVWRPGYHDYLTLGIDPPQSPPTTQTGPAAGAPPSQVVIQPPDTGDAGLAGGLTKLMSPRRVAGDLGSLAPAL